MGLGKTLQVITLLQKIKNEGLLEKKKAIVVLPTGLITNWQSEIERFASNLSVFIYHGQQRDFTSFNKDILLIWCVAFGYRYNKEKKVADSRY